ncbi:unnamed protein product [Nesidiocoris tenuis]|uniref:Uncharacterized protein n=1 Tax=Nesidiocoris tenuis TaxID=355587 RepID=A0A6H5G7G6_9HEMI|nr:unnamed protein product [Nesidiocoris tenuis]
MTNSGPKMFNFEDGRLVNKQIEEALQEAEDVLNLVDVLARATGNFINSCGKDEFSDNVSNWLFEKKQARTLSKAIRAGKERSCARRGNCELLFKKRRLPRADAVSGGGNPRTDCPASVLQFRLHRLPESDIELLHQPASVSSREQRQRLQIRQIPLPGPRVGANIANAIPPVAPEFCACVDAQRLRSCRTDKQFSATGQVEIAFSKRRRENDFGRRIVRQS